MYLYEVHRVPQELRNMYYVHRYYVQVHVYPIANSTYLVLGRSYEVCTMYLYIGTLYKYEYYVPRTMYIGTC